MAKSKSKDKISFNNLLRLFFSRNIIYNLSVAQSRHESEEIINEIHFIKDYFKDKNVVEYTDTFTRLEFINILNVIEEICIALTIDATLAKSRIVKLKDNLINNLDQNVDGIKLYSAFESLVSKIAYVYNGERSYNNLIGTSILACVNNFILYTTTYLHKFQNKRIIKCEIEKGKLVLKYSTKKVIDEQQIERLYKSILLSYGTDLSSDTIANRIRSYVFEISQLSRYVISNDFTADIKDCETILVYAPSKKIPLAENGVPILKPEEITNIFKNRLYATPNSGIRFELIDNNSIIGHIDMFENSHIITFNVYIKNEDNIYLVDDTYLYKHIDYSDMFIKLYYANKDDIKDFKKITSSEIVYKYSFNKDIYNKLITSGYSLEKAFLDSHRPKSILCFGGEGSKSAELSSNLYNLIDACMYCALCEPDKFSGKIKISTISKSKHKSFTKEEYYRVEHFRKLPANQSMREGAIKNAREAGFFFIPEGYTFVKASNVHLNSKMKVIKMTKKN